MLSKHFITSGSAENSEKRGQRSVAMERRLEVFKKKNNNKKKTQKKPAIQVAESTP